MGKGELVKIKKTQSIEMYYGEDLDGGKGIHLDVNSYKHRGKEFSSQTIYIPMSKIFQVKRGLESAIQRFYRRKRR